MRRSPWPRYTGKVQNRVLSDTASGGQSSFIVELAQQADLSRAYSMKDQDARGWYVYRTLKRTAERTQAPIKAVLDKQGVTYRSFWVANEIIVRSGDRPLVNSLAARPDVKVIEANDASNWLTSTDSSSSETRWAASRRSRTRSSRTWLMVHAPDLWNLGFTGTGIVVANQDTGMRWTHNALKPHYRGWNGSSEDHNFNWHDSIHADIGGTARNPCGYNSMVPCDDHGHGTHTTGTAVGDDGAGNQIGVAPGAKWIGCRNMDMGTREAGDVHGVLPVLHRPDRSERPERRSDEAASHHEQQLGLPRERALRAEQPADDRREHAGRGHLRRGLGRERRVGLLDRQ